MSRDRPNRLIVKREGSLLSKLLDVPITDHEYAVVVLTLERLRNNKPLGFVPPEERNSNAGT